MPQTSGPSTITSPSRDTRTLSHTGSEVGDENVMLEQNQPNRDNPVVTWQVPKKFTQMAYAAGKHFTRAEFRTREDITGTANDDTVVSLDTDIVPIGGEPEIADQPYPVAVAYNVTTDTEYDITDVDYGTNEVTLGTNPADGDEVAIWPVPTDGTVQYRAFDSFGHQVGPLDEWGVPLHVFADFNQEKNNTRIHLVGAGQFSRNEELALFVNSEQPIVWEDADYPRGQYASHIEQRVDVEV